MRRLLLISLAILLLVPIACAREGIGITPGCIGADQFGNCTFTEVKYGENPEFEFHIYNFENNSLTFNMRAEVELSENIVFTPETFTLEPKTSGQADCNASKGCQIVIARLNTNKLASQKEYSSYIFASTTTGEEGTLNVIQEVGSKMMIKISAPWYVLAYYSMQKFVQDNWLYILIIIIAIVSSIAGFFVWKNMPFVSVNKEFEFNDDGAKLTLEVKNTSKAKSAPIVLIEDKFDPTAHAHLFSTRGPELKKHYKLIDAGEKALKKDYVNQVWNAREREYIKLNDKIVFVIPDLRPEQSILLEYELKFDKELKESIRKFGVSRIVTSRNGVILNLSRIISELKKL